MKANTGLDQLMSENIKKKGRLLESFKKRGFKEIMNII
jgi:hypothetical protein